ncbi:hypothetical protein JTB14_026486 [Gonioctena quinquepunctata]|nr:hypothetical protein JTB14_026486 [Gonioctena quinquepunctata]
MNKNDHPFQGLSGGDTEYSGTENSIVQDMVLEAEWKLQSGWFHFRPSSTEGKCLGQHSKDITSMFAFLGSRIRKVETQNLGRLTKTVENARQ